MMKTDLCTKTILTTIAISLRWFGINMTPSVFANKKGVVDVNIVKLEAKYIIDVFGFKLLAPGMVKVDTACCW